MSKTKKNLPVVVDSLKRICMSLDCNIEDINGV